MIAVIAHPAARLGGLLARPALVWLGLRSYSFYLWHWPVLALTRPGLDVSLPRGVLIPMQLLAVLALADLSYRFVELPFRGKRKLRDAGRTGCALAALPSPSRGGDRRPGRLGRDLLDRRRHPSRSPPPRPRNSPR